MMLEHEILDIVFRSLVSGVWFLLLPSILLTFLSTAAALDAASLRLGWLGCLASGGLGVVIGLGGGLSFTRQFSLPAVDAASPWWSIAVGIYLIGVLWILGRTLVGWWSLQRWTASARPVHERRVIDAFEVAKAALDIRFPCYLLVGREVPTAFSVGLLNHRVLLPTDLLEELDDEELRDLALHEMAHVRRGDPAVFAVAVLAKALLWPNPLVWLAVHQLKLSAEKLADEAVVSVTEEVKPYSRLLLKMSERSTRGAMVPLAAGVYLHKSFFIQRAEALVGGMLTGGHPKASPALVWACLLLGGGIALGFSPNWAAENRVGPPVALSQPTEAPVKQLLRDGLFFDEAWVRHEAPDIDAAQIRPDLEPQWLGALEIESVPRFHAYRHLYADGGGKQSIFAFESREGRPLILALERGVGAGTGLWRIGRDSYSLEQLEEVSPGSKEEQAIVRLLKAWPIAALGSEAQWRELLREWPDVTPGSTEDAALMMGESLETFRELRLHGE
jgi:Zn-dependent protease with chaperone function